MLEVGGSGLDGLTSQNGWEAAVGWGREGGRADGMEGFWKFPVWFS